MKPDPTPKKPREKDDEYMRKAYIYSAILLVLGLIGGLLLAERIISAEAAREAPPAEVEELEEAEDGDTRPEDMP